MTLNHAGIALTRIDTLKRSSYGISLDNIRLMAKVGYFLEVRRVALYCIVTHTHLEAIAERFLESLTYEAKPIAILCSWGKMGHPHAAYSDTTEAS